MTMRDEGNECFRLCDLPDEIVIHILDRLNSMARARFSAVCKAWKLLLRRLLQLLAEAKDVPWVVTPDAYYKCQSMVLHQICLGHMQQKPCTEIKRVLKQEQIDAILPAALGSCIIRCGPDFGWVVLESITVGLAALCLYSPFTEKFIYLPPNLPIIYSKFAMSHPPTCSHCVFFAFGDCGSEVCAYTCRLGDQNWKKHGIDIVESVRGQPTLESLVFLEGIFYCLFDSGQLVAFKVADESWKLLADSKPYPSCGHFLLAECDGDILLVPYYCLPRNCGCSVWKYKRAERGWKKMNNLGGRLLFLNHSSSRNAAVAAVGELEGLADRIYCLGYRHLGSYFSLRDGKFHFGEDYDSGGLYWITPPSLQI